MYIYLYKYKFRDIYRLFAFLKLKLISKILHQIQSIQYILFWTFSLTELISTNQNNSNYKKWCTVGDWRRNKAQIEAFCSKLDSSKALDERSTLKKAKTEKLETWWSSLSLVQATTGAGHSYFREHSKRESPSSQPKI